MIDLNDIDAVVSAMQAHLSAGRVGYNGLYASHQMDYRGAWLAVCELSSRWDNEGSANYDHPLARQLRGLIAESATTPRMAPGVYAVNTTFHGKETAFQDHAPAAAQMKIEDDRSDALDPHILERLRWRPGGETATMLRDLLQGATPVNASAYRFEPRGGDVWRRLEALECAGAVRRERQGGIVLWMLAEGSVEDHAEHDAGRAPGDHGQNAHSTFPNAGRSAA